MTIFTELSSCLRVTARVHPVHLTNADSAPDSCQPSDQGCYHPHPPSPFYYYSAQRLAAYSFYRSTEGERPSRPRHCSKGCAARAQVRIAVAVMINTTAILYNGPAHSSLPVGDLDFRLVWLLGIRLYIQSRITCSSAHLPNTQNPTLFNGPGTSQKCPFPLGRGPHLTAWGPCTQVYTVPNPTRDRFVRFCGAQYPCAQHTPRYVRHLRQ